VRDAEVSTRDWYRAFADVEAAGSSPIYERAARAVADDDALIERLRALPIPKRQPNLLFSACRYLSLPLGDPTASLELMHQRWDDVRAVVLERSTQTNEAARTGTFVPLLGQIDGPLALIEVGASAGLCLFPDRYRIRYSNAPAYGPTDSPVTFDVHTSGPVPMPQHSLEVVWRAGIDLNPLDVCQPDDLAWLSACIWPEHTERQERLRAAAEVAAREPPEIRRGDLVVGIDDLLAGVPAGATPVVFHSAALAYVEPERRVEFGARVRAHPATVWISNEGPGVVGASAMDLVPPERTGKKAFFVVGIGERTVAISDPHGSWLKWAAEGR
jgi:hypothetical protein